MTSRQLYEAVLIELNKENAPNILLEDFNYWANKGVQLYINKKYNIYDVNQQTTDDIRVLKSTAILPMTKCYSKYNTEGVDTESIDFSTLELLGFLTATYETVLPSDYYHLLNCICIYKVNKTFKCYDLNDFARAKATRLTSDLYSEILDNSYFRPDYKRPYYFIHNVNLQIANPTNPVDENWTGSTDIYVKNIGYHIDHQFDGDDERLYYGDIQPDPEENPITGWVVSNFGATKEAGVLLKKYENGSWDSHDETKLKAITDDKAIFKTYDDNYIYFKYNSSSMPKWSYEVITPEKAKELTYFVNDDKDGNKVPIAHTDKIPLFTKHKVYGEDTSPVERAAKIRYGNASEVRLEVRYGSDDSLFKLTHVMIDYIKTPLHIRLTLRQLDKTEDTSQVLEFPDYVCQEIVNEVVHLVMEQNANQRLQTHPVVTQSIANPAQAQTQQQAE